MRHIVHFVLTILMFFFAALPVRAAGDVPATFQKAMADYVQNASFLIRNNIDWRMVHASEAEALLVIRFRADGVFESVKIVERSGNPAFDVALESAVRRSIPMLRSPPIPPGGAAPLMIPMRFRVAR
jgi:TonB family protein